MHLIVDRLTAFWGLGPRPGLRSNGWAHEQKQKNMSCAKTVGLLRQRSCFNAQPEHIVISLLESSPHGHGTQSIVHCFGNSELLPSRESLDLVLVDMLLPNRAGHLVLSMSEYTMTITINIKITIVLIIMGVFVIVVIVDISININIIVVVVIVSIAVVLVVMLPP